VPRVEVALWERSLSPTIRKGDGAARNTNPEQLFAVGYGACFNGALALVSKAAGVDASESQVRTHVGFGPEGESYAITVDIEAVMPGIDLAKAQELVEAAHQVCPYSKATRGNVPVTVKAVESF
jgi:osmotically inducible protein OsmC